MVRWRQRISDNGGIKHAAHRHKFCRPLARTLTDAGALRRRIKKDKYSWNTAQSYETAGSFIRQIYFEINAVAHIDISFNKKISELNESTENLPQSQKTALCMIKSSTAHVDTSVCSWMSHQSQFSGRRVISVWSKVVDQLTDWCQTEYLTPCQPVIETTGVLRPDKIKMYNQNPF